MEAVTLWNVGRFVWDYTAEHPRRQSFTRPSFVYVHLTWYLFLLPILIGKHIEQNTSCETVDPQPIKK
jgi:hypothetical protein